MVIVTGTIPDMHPGEYLNFTITLKKAGVAQDITGDTVTLRIKEAKSDSDTAALITLAADVTSQGASGVAVFELDHDDTADVPPGSYYIEIEWVISSDEEYIVYDGEIVFSGGTVDAYCTPDEIRAQIDKESEDDDATLWVLCFAASRAIDRYCGWEDGAFNVDSTLDDEERTYLGAGYGVLLIGDGLLSVSSVSIDDTALDADTYRGWPENASAKGKPFMGLRRLPLGGYWSENTDVAVTGQYGYSHEIPDLIRQAAVVVAARLWNRGQQGYGDASANVDLGRMFYTGQIDPQVKLWLNRFVKGDL